MELGDLQLLLYPSRPPIKVAILAIMELGDLPPHPIIPVLAYRRRNPRYNGIG